MDGIAHTLNCLAINSEGNRRADCLKFKQTRQRRAVYGLSSVFLLSLIPAQTSTFGCWFSMEIPQQVSTTRGSISHVQHRQAFLDYNIQGSEIDYSLLLLTFEVGYSCLTKTQFFCFCWCFAAFVKYIFVSVSLCPSQSLSCVCAWFSGPFLNKSM